MNRSALVRLVLGAVLFGAACVTLAQQALEIIPLRHRTVEQVLPALQPLLEPGGTLSGSRGQLFLRASPGNAAEVKRALEAIDRPLKRLLISVRTDDTADRERRAIGASGTIGTAGSRIGIHADDSRGTSDERVDQRVQVLEGGRATILTGQSVPRRDFIQDMASGFEVVPRLAGGLAVLDILTDSAQGQRVATTVTARLGEWVEVGGTESRAARDDRSIASASRARGAESRRVWLKVEELPN